MRAKLQVNFEGDKTGVKTRSMLVCRNEDVKESKRKVWRCLSANRLSFSELFDDISLVLNVRRLCVVVDSRFSAAKVCDCVVFAWYSKAEVRYVVCWLSCCTRIFCASQKKRFVGV